MPPQTTPLLLGLAGRGQCKGALGPTPHMGKSPSVAVMTYSCVDAAHAANKVLTSKWALGDPHNPSTSWLLLLHSWYWFVQATVFTRSEKPCLRNWRGRVDLLFIFHHFFEKRDVGCRFLLMMHVACQMLHHSHNSKRMISNDYGRHSFMIPKIARISLIESNQ